MSSSHPPPVVIILNSTDDLLDMLRVEFENQGFHPVTARLADVQSGELDLVTLVKEHTPVAVVYDIPRPYEANWNFLRLLRETRSLKDLCWVITTTNKAALEGAVTRTDALEVVLGKPYTVDQVVGAVRQWLSRDGHGRTKE